MNIYRLAICALSVCAVVPAYAVNFLVNGGFETGDEKGWTTNEPLSLQTAYPPVQSSVVHSGQFAVFMPQDYYIDQRFAPEAVSSLQNVSYWIKQDPFQPYFFTANILYYSDGTSTYVVPRPVNNGGWYNMDLTSDLAAGKDLVGIRVYGATTIGGPSPKTYFDDFNVGSPVVPEPATLTALAIPLLGLFRKRKLSRA